MNDSNFFIVGANGQLGTALRAKYPNAQFADIDQLDITNQSSVENFNWANIKVVLNTAAFTNVDGAETPEGRVAAWRVNADAVANLVAVAAQKDLAFVHISTDYVFDGTKNPHTETEAFSPLSVYGASKAAGDLLVSMLPKHYILRTSWVIGEGNNFVRSIIGLAGKNISPKVVADQFGRLTFTTELVRAIDHLLAHSSLLSAKEPKAPYGTYNVSNGGKVGSWSEIARKIYHDLGRNDLSVGDTTAKKYFAGKVSAPRPTYSTLDLSRIEATGFKPSDWQTSLKTYIQNELS